MLRHAAVWAAFLASLSVGLSLAATEILKNPGFESGVSQWTHHGFTLTTVADHVHGGVAAVLCQQRASNHQGPSQLVTLTSGKTYEFTAWVKVTQSSAHYQQVSVKVQYDFADGSNQNVAIAIRKFITTSDGWVQVGGFFDAPTRALSQARVHLEGPSAHTDFYVDEASLTQVPDSLDWQRDADLKIEANRKSDLHIDVTLDSSMDQSQVMVQISQLKHSFGWGSLVRPDWMIDPDYHQYQQVVYAMFNWATVQDYKWKYNRGNATAPDYTVAVDATDVLNSYGVHVRGHAMFWAVEDKNPDYVTKLTGPQLKQTIDERTAYMTGITKGKLAHWDVNNELTHGQFYEQHTGDAHITEHMFTSLHAADPKPVLFLNDFSIVSRGWSTHAYLEQIQDKMAANVSLGGVGIQSHFNDFTEPNPTLINARLDHIAKAGLPIWITELDMTAPDEASKADWLEKMYRLYFAHPAVQGVVHWGFWDHDLAEPNKALVQGYGFELNKAGKRFLQLTKETWSTQVNQSLAASTSFDIRGFRGNYEAVVWYKGMPIQRSVFFLGSHAKTVAISVQGAGTPITLPELPTRAHPFNVVGQTHPEVSSTHLHTLGQVTSASTRATLECTSRWSRLSAPSNGEAVEVACHGDEVLTGCSSLLKNHDWHKDGEQIKFQAGKPVCRALDGYKTTAGVQAIARCCSVSGLSCTYSNAGPSGNGVDDRVEVPCQAGSFPLGCSSWTSASHSDGSLLTNTSCIAQNDDPNSGVYSYAACCSAPRMTCQTVSSAPSGLLAGDKVGVACPLGYMITGCSTFSSFGRVAGAYVTKENGTEMCTAVNGADKHGGEIGVQAKATCCAVV